jgi:hypothetical protein
LQRVIPLIGGTRAADEQVAREQMVVKVEFEEGIWNAAP